MVEEANRQARRQCQSLEGGDGNGWKWSPNPGSPRGGSWGPKFPIKTPKGSQPKVSWDPDPGPHGKQHYDMDDGNGNRTRFDKDGKPLPTQRKVEIPVADPDSGYSPDPVVNPIDWRQIGVDVGVVVVVAGLVAVVVLCPPAGGVLVAA